MATEVIRVVDPDMGSGYTYDSLLDWEADLGDTTTGNLPSDDQIAVAKCRCTGGTADSSPVDIDGWTTDSTHYIKVWTDPAESYRHSGKWETGNKYRLVCSAQYYQALGILESYVRVHGILVQNTHATEGWYGVTISPLATRLASSILIDSVIVKNATNASYGQGFAQTDALAIYVNCISYGNVGAGFAQSYGPNGPAEQHFKNCVAAGNGGVGFYGRAEFSTEKNCYSGGNTGDDYSDQGGDVTRTTCASEDATGSITGVAYSISSGAYFTNITAGSEDFHIQSASSLKGAGTNLYNDATYAFQTDIDGQDRGGSGVANWDIGADELTLTMTQYAFRFRNDDGDEDAATWKAAENENVYIAKE